MQYRQMMCKRVMTDYIFVELIIYSNIDVYYSTIMFAGDFGEILILLAHCIAQ
jgi:hypothetical protein